jgi:hypothetical protein
VAAIEVAVSQAWSPPKVADHWVVWIEFDDSSARQPAGVMYAVDLREMGEPVIVTETATWVADLSGDLVAFVQPSAADPERSEVVVSSLATEEIVYAVETGLNVYPLDVDGSTLVYAAWASCYEGPIGFCSEPHIINVVDLDSGATRTLRSHINTHEGGFPITTDGRFVVFQSMGGMGYDLLQDTFFLLPNDAHSAKLDDGIVVWVTPRDWEHGPTDIRIAPADELASGARSRYFTDTGVWLSGNVFAYWNANGGQDVLGAPLTALRSTTDAHGLQYTYTAQWFEQGRVELHPQHAGTVYEVQLGRLGAELLESQGRDWLSFPTADPNMEHYVPQTGHTIAPQFWDHWSSHGLEFGTPGVTWDESVALFGYPISEPMLETNSNGNEVLTQYFERAIFEWHPENDEGSQVVLRRIGLEALLGQRKVGP